MGKSINNVSSTWTFDEEIDRRVDRLIETHNLRDLYRAERKFPDTYQEDHRKHWFDEKEWAEKKEAEEIRSNRAGEEFDEVYQIRLKELYKNEYKETGSFDSLTQSGLDSRVVKAFKENSDAQKRLASQKELIGKIEKQFTGKGPSLVDKMMDNQRFLEKRMPPRDSDTLNSHYALGRDIDAGMSTNNPRTSERRWMDDNLTRFRSQERLCKANLESVLNDGTSLDGVSYNEKNTIQSNIGKAGTAKSMTKSAASSALDFANNVFNSGGDRSENSYKGGKSYSEEKLANWGAYRNLKKKEQKLANSYSGSLGFVNKRSLSELEAIKKSVYESAQGSISPEEIYYLDKYQKELDNTIESLKQVLAKEQEELDNKTQQLDESTNVKMQDALDDKHARLKWNILCMILMASPFAQGLMVAGPLFDYLSFLGDILDPIFMNEDGFAAGFAQALENFPIFGDLLRLMKFSDGVEWMFNEVPVVNAFTGQDGLIDGLTRNDIFTGVAETINFEYLSLAGMAGGAAYLVGSNVNAVYGDKTTNTKDSLKLIKKDHMDQLKKIFDNAADKSSGVDENQSLEYNKKITKLNRDYFKKSAIAQILEDSIDNSVASGKIDDLLRIFDGIDIFGQGILTTQDKLDQFRDHLKTNVFSENPESDFVKRATILANEIVKDSDVGFDHVSNKIAGGEDEFRKADNAFSMHYYSREMKSLDIPADKLWDMAKSNDLKDFNKVRNMMEEMDNTISERRTDVDKRNGASFFPNKTITATSYKELGSLSKGHSLAA